MSAIDQVDHLFLRTLGNPLNQLHLHFFASTSLCYEDLLWRLSRYLMWQP